MRVLDVYVVSTEIKTPDLMEHYTTNLWWPFPSWMSDNYVECYVWCQLLKIYVFTIVVFGFVRTTENLRFTEKKGYARIDSFVMIDNTMQIVTAYLSI